MIWESKAFIVSADFVPLNFANAMCPGDLEKFWLGHANKDVTDKYAERR